MPKYFSKEFVNFTRLIYQNENEVTLHRPIFDKNDISILKNTIDSNFVSTAGPFVEKFEKKICQFTKSNFAVSMVNATSAIHIALRVLGVEQDNEVICQSFSFVAAANAITYTGARPIFIDISEDDLGLNPDSLEKFLLKNAKIQNGKLINKITRKRISCCIATHIYGHPCKIKKIRKICKNYNIPLIEDAAESLGSYTGNQHTGTFGEIGIISFNGNKIITTGGGGALLTNSKKISDRARHISSTAKVPHTYEYIHDEVGYNYRLPSLNASLGYSQMKKIKKILKLKRKLSKMYKAFSNGFNVSFLDEPNGTKSNFWLNTIIFNDEIERNEFLEYTNQNGVMTRPAWKLMHHLSMYKDSYRGDLQISENLQKRVVNIPSSVPNIWFKKLI